MSCKFITKNISFYYVDSDIGNEILFENHCHSKYEMLGVLEGKANVNIEGQNYILRDDQVIFVPPTMYHAVTVSKNGAYKRVVAHFNQAAIPEALKEELEKNRFVFFSFHSTKLKEFQKICESGRYGFHEPLAESLMVTTLYEYVDSMAVENKPDTEVDIQLQQIISYIDKHLCEKINVDDIAVHVARSKSSVCHLFQERMKTSLKQYVIQKKLAFAENMISNGTPPTVAAFQIGYNNYSDFYRMYVKHIQKSPSADKVRK